MSIRGWWSTRRNCAWNCAGTRCCLPPGLSFGSQYVISPMEGQVYDYLPETMIATVRNLRDFAGALALDKWTCNANGRQAAFWKKARERKFTASFIDQGYCFNAGEWNFPDAPLRGVFGRNDVYACITGWDSFEPWLGKIESFPESSLWPLAEEIPAGVVWVRRGRVTEIVYQTAGATIASARADFIVQEFEPESVPELAGSGELGANHRDTEAQMHREEKN